MKTPEEHFRDWESDTFGYGYGTGEQHTIVALKLFMMYCKPSPIGYDAKDMEFNLTPTVAWLLINILCKASIIEYGTPPRFGWMTTNGVRLREFVRAHTAADLINIATDYKEGEYIHCMPGTCNCDEDCDNPFWRPGL